MTLINFESTRYYTYADTIEASKAEIYDKGIKSVSWYNFARIFHALALFRPK